jgi:hypothetical protein
MPGWIDRYRKRQRELAEGADADLMQANRRRSGLAFRLMTLGLVMGLLGAKLHLVAMLGAALQAGGVFSFLLAVGIAKWAQQEQAFLTRPDSEGPPEIFRDRP